MAALLIPNSHFLRHNPRNEETADVINQNARCEQDATLAENKAGHLLGGQF